MTPTIPAEEARARFAAARVARLATVRPDGGPHLVPVTFAVLGSAVVFAVDQKPKSTTALQRLVNIRADDRVSFLVDAYDEDWSALWWVRADGHARLLDEPTEPTQQTQSTEPTEPTQRAAALDALAARYEQYRDDRPAGPVVWSEVDDWTAWAATGTRVGDRC